MSQKLEVKNGVSKVDQIRLMLHGWVETPREILINCPTHGIGAGYIHGHREIISCRQCLKELIEEHEQREGLKVEL